MDKLQSIDEVTDDEEQEEQEEEQFADDDSVVSSDSEEESEEDSGLMKDINDPQYKLTQTRKNIKKLRKAKKVDLLLDEYIRCVVLCRIVHSSEGLTYAVSHSALAEAYLEVKKFPLQCLNHCEKAKQILTAYQSKPTTEPVLFANCMIHYNMSRALAKQKKYKMAEKEILKAEGFFRKWANFSEPSDSEIDEMELKISNIAAKLYMCLSNIPAAETYFLKCKDMIENIHGKNSTELIGVLHNLGKMEQSRKDADNDKALRYYIEAHTLASEYEGNDSLLPASTAHALASAYSNISDVDAQMSAESYLNEALSIYQLHHGPDNVITLRVIDDLIRVLVQSDRTGQAIVMLAKSTSARCNVYGRVSREISATYKLLGSLHLSLGDTDKCLSVLKKALILETMLLGANNKSTKDLQNMINMLLTNPKLSSKFKKELNLDKRPRFNSIVNRNT